MSISAHDVCPAICAHITRYHTWLSSSGLSLRPSACALFAGQLSPNASFCTDYIVSGSTRPHIRMTGNSTKQRWGCFIHCSLLPIAYLFVDLTVLLRVFRPSHLKYDPSTSSKIRFNIEVAVREEITDPPQNHVRHSSIVAPHQLMTGPYQSKSQRAR